MGLKLTAIFSAGVGLLTLSVPTHSHHGTSIVYDLTQSITISGTVTDFRLVNPHTLIYLNVRGEEGEVVGWLGGLISPIRLARNEGWTRDTLKPGDEISVTGAPARGGEPSVWVEQVILNGAPLLHGEYTG
jgi:hypothetical protein